MSLPKEPEVLNEYYVYRSHAKVGIGNGDVTHEPSDYFPSGDQYLAASEELVNARILPELALWFSLDSETKDHLDTNDGFICWSYFKAKGLVFVACLSPFNTFGEKMRTSYFAHARAWRVKDLPAGISPLALLGDNSNFDRPWRTTEERQQRNPLAPAPLTKADQQPFVELLNDSGNQETVISLFKLLLEAVGSSKNLIVGASMEDLLKGSELPRMVALASMALPDNLAENLTIRFYSRHSISSFSAQSGTTFLVVPQEELSRYKGNQASIRCSLLGGQLSRGSAVDSSMSSPWSDETSLEYLQFVFQLLTTEGLSALSRLSTSVAAFLYDSRTHRFFTKTPQMYLKALAALNWLEMESLKNGTPDSGLRSKLFASVASPLFGKPKQIVELIFTPHRLSLFGDSTVLLNWLIDVLPSYESAVPSAENFKHQDKKHSVIEAVRDYLQSNFETIGELALAAFQAATHSLEDAQRVLNGLAELKLLNDQQTYRAVESLGIAGLSPKYPGIYRSYLFKILENGQRLPSVAETNSAELYDKEQSFKAVGADLIKQAVEVADIDVAAVAKTLADYCRDRNLSGWVNASELRQHVFSFLLSNVSKIQADDVLTIVTTITTPERCDADLSSVADRLDYLNARTLTELQWPLVLELGTTSNTLISNFLGKPWSELPDIFLTSFADVIYENTQIYVVLTLHQKEHVIRNLVKPSNDVIGKFYSEIDAKHSIGRAYLAASPVLSGWYQWRQKASSEEQLVKTLMSLLGSKTAGGSALIPENWDFIMAKLSHPLHTTRLFSSLKEMGEKFGWVASYESIQIKHLIARVENIDDPHCEVIKTLVLSGNLVDQYGENKFDVDTLVLQQKPDAGLTLLDRLQDPGAITSVKIKETIKHLAALTPPTSDPQRINRVLAQFCTKLVDFGKQKTLVEACQEYSFKLGAFNQAQLRNIDGNREVYWLYELAEDCHDEIHLRDLEEQQWSKSGYKLDSEVGDPTWWKSLAIEPRRMSNLFLYLLNNRSGGDTIMNQTKLLKMLSRKKLLHIGEKGLLRVHEETPMQNRQLDPDYDDEGYRKEPFIPFLRLYAQLIQLETDDAPTTFDQLSDYLDGTIEFESAEDYRWWKIAWINTICDRVNPDWSLPFSNTKRMFIKCPKPRQGIIEKIKQCKLRSS